MGVLVGRALPPFLAWLGLHTLILALLSLLQLHSSVFYPLPMLSLPQICVLSSLLQCSPLFFLWSTPLELGAQTLPPWKPPLTEAGPHQQHICTLVS